MSPAEEIVVKLTAQAGDLNSGMDAAAAKVRSSTEAMSASVAQAANTFRNFDNIQKGSIKTAQDVANAQATLTAAQASGAYTTEELAAKQALLDAAMVKLPRELEAASAATVAFTSNTRVMGEVSTIVSEAMSGNFGRIRRSAAALANQSGILAAIFSPIGALVAETAAAIGGLVYVTAQAEEYQGDLSKALLLTSGAAGFTRDQLLGMTEDLQSYGSHAGNAREIILGLTNSGRVGFDQLGDASRAASLLVELTGVKAEDAVRKLIAMGDDPVRAARSLEEQFGFLTQKQADEIVSLQNAGERSQAFGVLLEALRGHLEDVQHQTEATTTRLEHFLHDLNPSTWVQAWEDGAHNIGMALDKAIDGPTLQDKFNTAANAYLQLVNEAKAHPVPWMESIETGGKGFAAAIEEARQKAYALQQQLQAVNNAARAAGTAAQQQKSGVLSTLGSSGKGGNGKSQEVSDDNKVGQQNADLGASKQEMISYWQQVSAAAEAGSQVWTNALDHINKLQSQVRAEAARTASQQTAEAKRAAAAVMQASDDEAAHDRQMMEQGAQQQRQIANETARDTERSSIDATQVKKEQYQELYRTGQISLQQLVQAEMRAVQEKLDAEIRYYNTLKVLDAGDVQATLKDQQAITDAVAKAAQERARIATRAANEELKQRQRLAHQEAQLAAQSVNQILFSHQSLRQSLASIGEQMLSRFIETEAAKVAQAWASQNAQTTATITGNQMRVAADQAGQAESLAVQGESAIKWIMTEAAKAAAGAFNALVSIPYVGPFLAVGASVAAFAAVAKLVSSVASAEGGWERVPADGMTTVLHKDEMVLPKHVADPVRNMAKNGGGGGEVHNHFHMTDTRGLQDMLRRNPGVLADAAKHMKRRGYRT